MRTSRILIGLALSIIAVVAFSIAFWLIAETLDRALGFPDELMVRQAAFILGGMSWALGFFWIFWALSYITFVGGGSPVEAFGVALEPTSTLVTGGPYAYTRNPMLFGMLFILLGVAFFANSASGIILVPIVGILGALYLRMFEEKELVRRFGVVYEHYRDHVPMLVPRPSPYVAPEPGA